MTVDINGPNGANGTVLSKPAGITCGPTCSADFADGSDVMLTATPGPNSFFGAWEGGFCSGTNPTCTVHLTRDAQVTAVFQFQPQDPCAGLGPDAVGEPTGKDQSNDPALFAETSNGDGIVAVSSFHSDMGEFAVNYTFFNPDGTQRGSFHGVNSFIAEKLTGFIVTRLQFDSTSGVLGRRQLLAVDDEGKIVASTSSSSESYDSMRVDPLGGVVVEAVARPPDVGKPVFLVWFDDQLNERWRAQLPDGAPAIDIGVDRQGNALVLTDGSSRYGAGTVAGVWIDASGNVGSPFKASDTNGILTARIGNGLFFQDTHGNWTAQFEPLAGPTPPPDWVVARPKTTVHMARGGRAYAFIAAPTTANNVDSCSTSVEVVAPSGKACGTAAFPTSSAPNGGPGKPSDVNTYCYSSIRVGYDGSAIQTRFAGDSSFSAQWWTGFFK